MKPGDTFFSRFHASSSAPSWRSPLRFEVNVRTFAFVRDLLLGFPPAERVPFFNAFVAAACPTYNKRPMADYMSCRPSLQRPRTSWRVRPLPTYNKAPRRGTWRDFARPEQSSRRRHQASRGADIPDHHTKNPKPRKRTRRGGRGKGGGGQNNVPTNSPPSPDPSPSLAPATTTTGQVKGGGVPPSLPPSLPFVASPSSCPSPAGPPSTGLTGTRLEEKLEAMSSASENAAFSPKSTKKGEMGPPLSAPPNPDFVFGPTMKAKSDLPPVLHQNSPALLSTLQGSPAPSPHALLSSTSPYKQCLAEVVVGVVPSVRPPPASCAVPVPPSSQDPTPPPPRTLCGPPPRKRARMGVEGVGLHEHDEGLRQRRAFVLGEESRPGSGTPHPGLGKDLATRRGLEQGFGGAVVSTARENTNAVRPGTVPVPGPRAHFALMPDQGPPSCAAVTGADEGRPEPRVDAATIPAPCQACEPSSPTPVVSTVSSQAQACVSGMEKAVDTTVCVPLGRAKRPVRRARARASGRRHQRRLQRRPALGVQEGARGTGTDLPLPADVGETGDWQMVICFAVFAWLAWCVLHIEPSNNYGRW
jgi:hypothetical protein